ncbi:MAG: multicopper oxidase family protein [Actinomycetales bacterium]
MSSRPPISRRRLLGWGVGACAAVALPGCTGRQSATPSASASGTPQTPSAVELEPQVRDLTLRLWAEASDAQIVPGTTSPVYRYQAEVLDGDPASVQPGTSYLGPTLHLRSGQRVRVNFENRLPEGETIVHWHGLLVPQEQDGQPGDAIAAGSSYDYDFVVENGEGTYWYHPHPHMHTGEQVYRGMAGLLIVHPGTADAAGALPTGANDLALVLQDRTVASDGSLSYLTSMRDQMMGFVGDTLVTNGVAGYAVSVRREAYRVRLLSGTNSRTQYLTWSTGDPMRVVATDGRALPQMVEVPGLLLTPAQRTDLWVDFSGFDVGETVQLRTANTFVESGGMGRGMGAGMGSAGDAALDLSGEVAATFQIADSPSAPGSIPESLGPAPSVLAEDAVNSGSPKQFVLSTARMTHWINGTQWEGRVASEVETVRAGTVELWEFVNQSPMAHPMHLHGQAFRVVSRSWDSTAAEASWASIEPGVVEEGMRDTIIVWPGQRVQIAVPFGPHLGYFLYHCHILEHEDAGMMRNFLVT